jgi:hypothetical protein
MFVQAMDLLKILNAAMRYRRIFDHNYPLVLIIITQPVWLW